MKTLYLIRHAKSAWNIEGLEDIDRHLNHRGYGDAHRMAARLHETVKHGHFVTSPAIRALTTALIFARTFRIDPSVIILEKRLYETSVNDYVEVIRSVEDRHDTLFIFGHNPIITATLNTICSEGTEDMPTCAIAGVEFNVNSWKAVEAQHARMMLYDFPKNEK